MTMGDETINRKAILVIAAMLNTVEAQLQNVAYAYHNNRLRAAVDAMQSAQMNIREYLISTEGNDR